MAALVQRDPVEQAWELATDLAVVDCGEKLRLHRAGKYVPASLEVLSSLRQRTKGYLRQGSMCSDMPDPRDEHYA